jgi:hypothetical protein
MSRFDPKLRKEQVPQSLWHLFPNHAQSHELSWVLKRSTCSAYQRLDIFFTTAPSAVMEEFKRDVEDEKKVVGEPYAMLMTLTVKEVERNTRRFPSLEWHLIESLSLNIVCSELLLYAIQAIQRMVKVEMHQEMQEELDRREQGV